MSRVLRGAWSRRGALATLVLMTLVVVAGAVTVLQFAHAAGTSRALTAPLLLLGAVAVPSLGAQLAVARREEIGLARLRGIHGLRLWRFLLLEPLLAIVLGTLAGLAVGALLTVVTTAARLDEAAAPLDRTALLAALAIAAAALVIVALGAGSALREPLAVQVATRRRPRRATTLAVFASVLVIVGAGVAAYRSRQVPGEPDLVVLLGPALVGLALGQVAVWLVRLTARAGTGATAGGGLGGFLAARRLARADDLVTPLRLVVAAAVVGCLALTGSVAVDRWTDGQSRLATAGPGVIESSAGALGAYRLTHELDPDGEHLMTTVLVPNEGRLAERRAYVDAARWDAVVGDLYDGTDVAPAAAAVERLVPPDTGLAIVPATRVEITARALVKADLRLLTFDGERFRAGSTGIIVTVSFVQPDNSSGSVSVPLRLLEEGSGASRSVRVPNCGDGCLVTDLRVERRLAATVLGFDDTDFEVLLTDLRFGDTDLLADPWTPEASAVRATLENRFGARVDLRGSFAINRPDGLQVRLLPDRALPLRTAAADEPLAVLTAGDPPEAALDLSGDERPTVRAGAADLLPLVGSAGTLADLPSSARGAGPTVPSAEVRIVAGEETPAAMLKAVEEATGASWRPLADVRRDLGAAHGGAQATAYALTALACALVAMLALGSAVARHLREYRRDVASLRVVGVGLGTVRRAGRAELAILALLVVGAVAAGGWLAVRLLLPGLPLLDPPVAALAVDTSPEWWSLVAPAVLAALVVLVVGGRARAVRAGTTQPALLREEEGR